MIETLIVLGSVALMMWAASSGRSRRLERRLARIESLLGTDGAPLSRDARTLADDPAMTVQAITLQRHEARLPWTTARRDVEAYLADTREPAPTPTNAT